MANGINEMLARIGVEQLNDMQIAANDAISKNPDVLLLSPTGSGKTLAFLLPLVQRLSTPGSGLQAVIIVPARELALQIDSVFKSLATEYRAYCCYGGHPFDVEQRSLLNVPDVIVGTPGRVVDHIEQKSFSPETASWLVLDEFDKSLEFGFSKEMEFISQCLTGLRHRVLLSATQAVEIPEFVGVGKNLVRVDFLKDSPAGLSMKIVNSPAKDKLATLLLLLCNLGNQQSIIFCNYREAVDRVVAYLKEYGIDCINFHGGMEQPERERALCMFRNGTIRTLVSTDLAARGLDIPDVENVIHYHFPSTAEAFTHRNGRTARMQAKGSAFLILGSEEALPDYVDDDIEGAELDQSATFPAKSQWTTLYIGKGKKDKVSKGDVAGFLMQKGMLKKDELGIIEVKERYALAAVKEKRISSLLKLISDQKIKGMKTKFEVAHLS